ncbi:MAG: tetratricopeptide repeat protein [Alphaproteobacteria bacterium]
MRTVAAALIGVSLISGAAVADGYDTVRSALDTGDYDTAYATLAEMSDAGDTLAMIMLSELQLSEVTGPMNYGIALTWLSEAAEHNNVHAMLRLGAIYQRAGQWLFPDWEGMPMTAGLSQAVHWYGQAADAGSTVGLSRLGLLYRLGLSSHMEGGISRDEEVRLTREILERAAEAGRSDAMMSLGLILRQEDPARSQELIRRAAEMGEPTALGSMAVRPEEGGVTDPVEALAWVYAAKIAWELDRNPRSNIFIVAGAQTGAEFLDAMNERIGEASPEGRTAAEARAAEISAGWVSLLPGQSGRDGSQD